MKLILNTRDLTISNSSAILAFDGSDGSWYDYPGHLGYCSRTGLNRVPKFIPEDHASAVTKGRTIYDLVSFLKSLKGVFYDAGDIDFETCLSNSIEDPVIYGGDNLTSAGASHYAITRNASIT